MYHFHGLTGSNRIVFEDLCQLLSIGVPVSITVLADKSGYSRSTIIRAMRHLRQANFVDVRHETNGKRAEYIILEEDGMINLGDMVRSLLNAVTMSSDERAKRLMMAVVSKGCYDDGHKLQRLARKIGGEFETSVQKWMEETGVLKVMTVWDLEEANLMRQQIKDLIAQAEEKLSE